MSSPFIRDLIAWAAEAPDAIAVATPTETITTAALTDRIAGVAEVLRGGGIRDGEFIAVSADGLDEIVGFLAVNAAGAIPVVTPSRQEFEASHADRLLCVDRDWAPTNSIDLRGLNTPSGATIRDRDHRTPAAAVLTSGTTGTPKLLLLEDETIDARMVGYFDWWPPEDFVNLFRLSAISGLSTLVAAFLSRRTYNAVSLIDRAAAEFCATITITRLAGSPHQIQSLIDVARKLDVTLHFDTVTSAGAPQTAPFLASVRSVCSGHIRSIYGSTEAGGVAIAHAPVEGAFRGEIGRGAEFDVKPDGTIRYRAPGLARNYRVGTELVPVAPDGWFYPGDIGFIDEHSKVVIERREGDVVNIGGVKVNPLEFESLAESVEGVKDAGCAAVTFPDGSNHLVLAVVVRDQTVYQSVVVEFSKLPTDNRPNVVVAVPSIPRNRNGKLMRDELAVKLTAAIRVQPKS